ncbi:MAG: phytoene desaturase family protein [Actinomycetales bacterium]
MSPRAVVVGAGLAGLAAGLHLAAAGWQVDVLEREPVTGGLLGMLVHDTGSGPLPLEFGPQSFGLPEVVRACFEAAGLSMDDHVTLTPLDPPLQARFADASVLTVHRDRAAMLAELADFCGPADRDGMARFLDDVTASTRSTLADLHPALDALLDQAGDGDSARRSGTLTRLGRTTQDLRRQLRAIGSVAGYVHDPRLRRLYDWTVVPGLSTPGTSALSCYADLVAGAWRPVGGMHRLAEGLAEAVRAVGGTIQTGVTVTGLVRRGRRVVAVRAEQRGPAGEVRSGQAQPPDALEIDCDALVLATDPVTARTLLDPEPGTTTAIRRWPTPPSCWLLVAAGQFEAPDQTATRTVSFGREGSPGRAGSFGLAEALRPNRSLGAEEVQIGRLPTDPTLLVELLRPSPLEWTQSQARPGANGEAAAGQAQHAAPTASGVIASVLTATPHLGYYSQMRRNNDAGRLVTTSQDWGRIAGHYRDHILTVLQARGFTGFGSAAVEQVFTPVDWLARGQRHGSPFAGPIAATARRQLLLRGQRPGNVEVADGGPYDLVAGALIRGMVAAERIRSWPTPDQ